jgi:hypothetical protein
MKTSTAVLLVLLGCGGLFVLIVALCAGGFFFAQNRINAAIEPKVDALFAKIDNGTFGEAYMTETTPRLREAISKEKWAEIGLVINQRLGHLRSKSMRQFSANQVNAITTIDAVYDGSFEKGSGTITVRYTRVAENLLLEGFHVRSPLLDVATLQQECPHCGELTPASAKFCAKCGKALKDDKPAPPAATKGKSKSAIALLFDATRVQSR